MAHRSELEPATGLPVEAAPGQPPRWLAWLPLRWAPVGHCLHCGDWTHPARTGELICQGCIARIRRAVASETVRRSQPIAG